jgi:hypothetical protein
MLVRASARVESLHQHGSGRADIRHVVDGRRSAAGRRVIVLAGDEQPTVQGHHFVRGLSAWQAEVHARHQLRTCGVRDVKNLYDVGRIVCRVQETVADRQRVDFVVSADGVVNAAQPHRIRGVGQVDDIDASAHAHVHVAAEVADAIVDFDILHLIARVHREKLRVERVGDVKDRDAPVVAIGADVRVTAGRPDIAVEKRIAGRGIRLPDQADVERLVGGGGEAGPKQRHGDAADHAAENLEGAHASGTRHRSGHPELTHEYFAGLPKGSRPIGDS